MVEWRGKMGLAEVHKKYTGVPWRELPHWDSMNHLIPSLALGGVLKDGHNLVQIVSGATLLQSLHRIEALPPDDLAEFLLIMNEVMWCEIDRRTRRSGYISRVVRIMDCRDITLMPLFQLRAFASHCAHVVQSYPVTVLKSLIINAPNWIRLGINAVSPFFNPAALKHWHVHVGDSEALVHGIIAKSELPADYGGGLGVGAWPLETKDVDTRIEQGDWAFSNPNGDDKHEEEVPVGEEGKEGGRSAMPSAVGSSSHAELESSGRMCTSRGWGRNEQGMSGGRSCIGLFRRSAPEALLPEANAPDAGPLSVRKPMSYEEALAINPYQYAKQREAAVPAEPTRGK